MPLAQRLRFARPGILPVPGIAATGIGGGTCWRGGRGSGGIAMGGRAGNALCGVGGRAILRACTKGSYGWGTWKGIGYATGGSSLGAGSGR
jgi:hypothetical protein